MPQTPAPTATAALPDQLRSLFVRTHARYQRHAIAKGALMAWAWPEAYRSWPRQRAALAIVATGAAVNANLGSSDGSRGVRYVMGAIDSSTSALAGVASSQLRSEQLRAFDQDWAIVNWLWAGAGASVFADRRRRQILLAIVSGIPLYRQLAGREPSTSRPAAIGLVFNWLGFLAGGHLFVRNVTRRAQEIAAFAERSAAEQRENADRHERLVVRHEVFAQCADVLKALRATIHHDRQRAAQLAREAEEQLRPWVESTRVSTPTSVTFPPMRARGAIARSIVRTELVVRVLELSVLATNIATSEVRVRPAHRRLALLVASANLAWAVRRRQAEQPTAASDAITGVVVCACEALGNGGREGTWGNAYAVCLAGTIGPSFAESRRGFAWITLLAGGTVAANWTRHRQSRRPLLKAASDGGFIYSSAMTSSNFAEIGRILADSAEQAETQAAAVEVEQIALARRRESQAFVHDEVLQVLAFCQKPEMSNAVLAEWIDEEITRVAAILSGDSPEIGPDLARSIQELVGAIRRRGLEVRVDVPARPIHLDSDHRRLAMLAVNEGLTNAMKHAPESAASVHVRERQDGFELEILNGLHGRNSVGRPGTGLKNLERAAATLGATISVGLEGDRFRLRLVTERGRSWRAH